MLILLAGVSFLFAIAQRNGTLDLILSWGLRLVGGKVAFLPWILFVISAALDDRRRIHGRACPDSVSVRFAARV